ncbi:hypothetical protein [Streptomyces lavendulae]|uniref:hypothetical protein n=1 Tax=Streptomyces lavendulae TaxID=1914 RepID=UPI002554A0A8|nr:hypothetical protein [Streptomyces lavendulae]
MEEQWLTHREINDLVMRAQNLGAADLRMIMYYATAVPAGNPVNETATSIGDKLGISSSSSSRAINRLTAAGWLQLSYKAAGLRFYALGPSALGQGEVESEQTEELASVHHLRAREE